MTKLTVAVATMLIGGLLYISSRTESLTMFRWFSLIGVQGVTDRPKFPP
jgi:hypothetical protein